MISDMRSRLKLSFHHADFTICERLPMPKNLSRKEIEANLCWISRKEIEKNPTLRHKQKRAYLFVVVAETHF